MEWRRYTQKLEKNNSLFRFNLPWWMCVTKNFCTWSNTYKFVNVCNMCCCCSFWSLFRPCLFFLLFLFVFWVSGSVCRSKLQGSRRYDTANYYMTRSYCFIRQPLEAVESNSKFVSNVRVTFCFSLSFSSLHFLSFQCIFKLCGCSLYFCGASIM